MNIECVFAASEPSSNEAVIYGVFQKTETGTGRSKQEKKTPVLTGLPQELKEDLEEIKAFSHFQANPGETFPVTDWEGRQVTIVGLGEKKNLKLEDVRRHIATTIKTHQNTVESVSIAADQFIVRGRYDETFQAISEAIVLGLYQFNKHKSVNMPYKLETIYLETKNAKTKAKNADKGVERGIVYAEAANVARDFVNEPPNVLNSETYAKRVEEDVKGIPGVKVKVLNKAAIKKEKMGLFLSVNAGSAFEPRLVHLTYTPKKVTSKTKHVALVGKGLTFDTGGYSLKPAASMVGMKFDMAGSATVYAAFKAAAQMAPNTKISCFLGMTDNAVNSLATMPDSVCTARNGKTVEILNTDAEGRLVLADVLSYASDQKPNEMIDAATLTGACLVSLGHEVCGLMGNDDKFCDRLLKTAEETSERMWQLPIFDEYREDMKSKIADLKNIGGSRFGGTSKAAAFLENFVGEGISWAHLDIAGIAGDQAHISYCPAKGASGLIVRTLANYLTK